MNRQAAGVQSDYDKLRRVPYLYAFNVLNMAALVCTVNSPLALYAAELGIEKGRIGMLAGIMPFAQVLCIAFLPLIMAYSQRFITGAAYAARYFFVLPWLLAPMMGSPDGAFWLLFGSMIGFSIARTLAETAIYPWAQEYMPRQMRGRINGIVSLAILPVALGGSVLIQLWLDSSAGIERYFPVFVIGALFGLTSVLSLIGLRGGNPRPDSPRGLRAIRAMRTPMRDGNFWLFLYSSGTQYFAYTAMNLFLVLFFRDRLGLSSGQLVMLIALVPVGGAVGALVAGWFVDRYGTRAIRVTLQSWQVVLLLSLLLVHPGVAFPEIVAGSIFFLTGMLFQSSITVGSIYMLNYVPPAHKENYMTLAYASDGIIGGGATFLAGFLLQFLDANTPTIMGVTIDSYEALFTLCAVVVATSALAFAALKEDGATGVRAFFANFGSGSAIRALLAIPRYGALTSEERRQELTYGFGGTRSALVKEELIAALSDPSFDVRHEAIQSLGRLPPGPAVIRALESMLTYDGLEELQYAALTSLGRLRAKESSGKIASFLDSPSALLRARAIRSLGEIRNETYLPRIRQMLRDDSEINCRLAAVSALGKYGDTPSVGDLVAIYAQLAADDTSASDEPRSKVVLLALAKILGLEEGFSREWRLEERILGQRLPRLIERLAWTVRRMPGKQSAELSALIKGSALGASTGETHEAFTAIQALAPRIETAGHADAALVLQLLQGTRQIEKPHRALLVLLALSVRKVLLTRR
ncbi:MAG: MFS transporter [Hyphomicrobiales bacterium]|nr:MAG: MFS transporter [Hyphomicrobiales bacterium]